MAERDTRFNYDVMAPTRSGDKDVKKRRGRPPGGGTSKRVAKPVVQKGRGSRKQSLRRHAKEKDEDDIPRLDRPATKQAKKSTTANGKAARKQPLLAESGDELSMTVDAEEEDEDELSRVDRTQLSRPHKHKADAQREITAEENSKSRKRYARLEVRTKRISQEQIDIWPQVSTQILEQIVTVVRDAKKDIANTQRDERRVIAAHNILNPLVEKLARQLSNSRIPPQTKDVHFNIDKLTERNAQLFREVTTARHAKQLLSEQVKVTEHLLKKDQERLGELKRNARKWKAEWKHQEIHGRVHPLLQESYETMIDNDGPEDIGLKRSAPMDTSLLDAPGSELAPIFEQLRRSLENMQGNHAQIEGIDEAMNDAQAALDNVLFRSTSAQQYATLRVD